MMISKMIRKMVEKKVIAMMLAAAMALSPMPAYAGEFSDGVGSFEDGDVFAAPEEHDIVRFSDDGEGAAAEIEEAAETEQDVLGAQDDGKPSYKAPFVPSL